MGDKVLFDNYILVQYGSRACIHSDQGTNFKPNLIKELCKIERVEKSGTIPYHPMGNGQVEKFNQTLRQMLGTLLENLKCDQKQMFILWSMSIMPHFSIGFSPYFLIFWRHPRLSTDAFLGLNSD